MQNHGMMTMAGGPLWAVRSWASEPFVFSSKGIGANTGIRWDSLRGATAWPLVLFALRMLRTFVRSKGFRPWEAPTQSRPKNTMMRHVGDVNIKFG